MKVLIVGSGMYVCGKNIQDYDGTIGPALLEAFKSNFVTSITIFSRSEESAQNACDILQGLQQQMSIRCPIDTITSIDNVDNKDYDCAIICTPDKLHAHFSILLAKKGLHILVVKPMATTTTEARDMINAVNTAKVIGRVEYHKRYDESNICLRNIIRNDELGILQSAYIEYSQRKSIPQESFKSWCTDTNIFQYLGTHYVDLIYWCTDYKPVTVMAYGQADYLTKKFGQEIYDSMQVIIQWQRDDQKEFISIHNTSWIDPETSSAMSNQRIKVFGTKGSFNADQKERGITLSTDKKGLEHLNPYFSRRYVDCRSNIFFKGYGIDSIIQFVRDCYLVKTDKSNIDILNKGHCTFEDGLVSVKVVECAAQSIEQKLPIRIA